MYFYNNVGTFQVHFTDKSIMKTNFNTKIYFGIIFILAGGVL